MSFLYPAGTSTKFSNALDEKYGVTPLPAITPDDIQDMFNHPFTGKERDHLEKRKQTRVQNMRTSFESCPDTGALFHEMAEILPVLSDPDQKTMITESILLTTNVVFYASSCARALRVMKKDPFHQEVKKVVAAFDDGAIPDFDPLRVTFSELDKISSDNSNFVNRLSGSTTMAKFYTVAFEYYAWLDSAWKTQISFKKFNGVHESCRLVLQLYLYGAFATCRRFVAHIADPDTGRTDA